MANTPVRLVLVRLQHLGNGQAAGMRAMGKEGRARAQEPNGKQDIILQPMPIASHRGNSRAAES